MPGRQPEDVIHDESLLSLGRFGKCRGLGGFLPFLAEISGAKNGRPKMPRLCRHQHCPLIARIEHYVMYDVAEEKWAFELPFPSLGIGTENESTFFGGDE